MLEVRVGGEVRRNVVFDKPSEGARWDAEDFRGPIVIYVRQGPFALRNFSYQPADFAPLTLPAASGGATNEKELVDSVALGKETFHAVGCEACHLVEPGSTAVSSGPNLFGLMRTEPRMREVAEGEGHRFQIKAGREYLHRSVRAPADQLAVAESGPTRGQAYLPVMPAFPKEILSDRQIDAIGDYLATLNVPGERGPVVRLIDQTPAPSLRPHGRQPAMAGRRRSAPAARAAGRAPRAAASTWAIPTASTTASIRACWPSSRSGRAASSTWRANWSIAATAGWRWATTAARSPSASTSTCSRR